MPFPKISVEVIEATAAVAQRKSIQNYALNSILDLMEKQPELTKLISDMCANMLAGGDEVETVSVEFARENILVASFAAYALAMDSVKAQIEADELNKEWA